MLFLFLFFIFCPIVPHCLNIFVVFSSYAVVRVLQASISRCLLHITRTSEAIFSWFLEKGTGLIPEGNLKKYGKGAPVCAKVFPTLSPDVGVHLDVVAGLAVWQVAPFTMQALSA